MTLTSSVIPVRVDLGVMTMKGYSTFPRATGQEPYNQVVYCFV